MSTKRLDHLKEGEKIYLEVTRKYNHEMDEMPLLFKTTDNQEVWVDYDDTFYTFEELTNDGMPKQGEMIEAKCEFGEWRKTKFICFLNTGDVLCRDPYEYDVYDEWRYPPKKIQKTLAELEKELGYEEGTLEITN